MRRALRQTIERKASQEKSAAQTQGGEKVNKRDGRSGVTSYVGLEDGDESLYSRSDGHATRKNIWRTARLDLL